MIRTIERREFCAGLAATLTTIGPGGCGRSSPTTPSQAPLDQAASLAPVPPTSMPTEPVPPPAAATVAPIPIVEGRLIGDELHVPVDEGHALSDTWGAARVQVARHGIVLDILLTRTSAATFTALNGVCTHEGCVVSTVARPVFVCPCHGSRYDHNGAVVRGPAPAALPRFATGFVARVVVVRM